MGAAPELVDHTLVVHLYSARDEPAYARLREFWKTCADGLGMTSPIGPLMLPREPPADQAELHTLIGRLGLAAQQTPDLDNQLILRRHDDVLCVSAALASSEPATWAELDRRWSAIAPPVKSWHLGETRLYQATVLGANDTGPDALDDLDTGPRAPDAASVYADSPAEEPSLGGGVLVGGHTMVWEVLDGRPEPRLRRIVAVTRQSFRAATDEWLWTRGDATFPPFAIYLRYAAEVRHLGIALDQGRWKDAVDSAHDLLEQTRPRLAEETAENLLRARHELARMLTGPGGLTDTADDLYEARRVIRRAAENMRSPVLTGFEHPHDWLGQEPTPRDDRSAAEAAQYFGLFATDRELAERLSDRFEDEMRRLEATRERAREVLTELAQSAATRLQQRREDLQRDEESSREGQQKLNLLQTAVIGAVLMVLAAIQSFGYQVRIPLSLMPAVIALLGSVALLLATLTLGNTRGKEGAVDKESAYLRVAVRVAAGLTGAAGGWVVSTLIHRLTTGFPAPVWLSLACAVPSFLAAFVIHRRVTRTKP
ncbi:CATRA conflict system CASPASE/TPR repeat-associated protein [Nonomuraea insulae]|uniref:CATRA conflict system CASPASE/TPR repeat-associated protein n=1 Tax=Nonomuraea insulae TaxID=1616787 RepID=A0ABW1CI18_9ACTN